MTDVSRKGEPNIVIHTPQRTSHDKPGEIPSRFPFIGFEVAFALMMMMETASTSLQRNSLFTKTRLFHFFTFVFLLIIFVLFEGVEARFSVSFLRRRQLSCLPLSINQLFNGRGTHAALRGAQRCSPVLRVA